MGIIILRHSAELDYGNNATSAAIFIIVTTNYNSNEAGVVFAVITRAKQWCKPIISRTIRNLNRQVKK